MSIRPFRRSGQSIVPLIVIAVIAAACGGSPGAATNGAVAGTTRPDTSAAAGGSGPADIQGLDPARVGTGVTPQGWAEYRSGSCRLAAPADWKVDPDIGTGPRPADGSVLVTLSHNVGPVTDFEAFVSQQKAAEFAYLYQVIQDDDRVFLKRSDPTADVLELVAVLKTDDGFCYLDLTLTPPVAQSMQPTAVQILESLGPAT